MQARIAKFLAIKCRSPKCCSCTNIMSRLATDCFAAAVRLQYTLFRTNSIDLNDALLVSIHDWMDAGSRELCIYGQMHMNGPPEMGRHFWGHLPLSWMHELMKKQEMMMCRKCQNWRKTRTKCSVFCTHVSRLESLWRRRVYGGSSALHIPQFTLLTPQCTL